jgi:hypothetical protein
MAAFLYQRNIEAMAWSRSVWFRFDLLMQHVST